MAGIVKYLPFLKGVRSGFRARASVRAAARAAADAEKDRLQKRRKIVDWYLANTAKLIEDWIVSDTEDSNFYYDLTDRNKFHLAHFVSRVTGADVGQIRGYFAELENDKALFEHLQSGVLASYPQKSIKVAYARRIGWYAVARATKPKVIVETGVDHGVGGCVLARAIMRNTAEGFAGHYFGLDLNPSAGRLFTAPYSTAGEIIYGDLIETLSNASFKIDLFVNDSDHHDDFEKREYAAMAPHLSPHAIILSDNSHATDELGLFAEARGMQFLYFSERPLDHWYIGGGIGAAFGSALA